MKRYVVSLYFNTQLRARDTVTSMNPLGALAAALDRNGSWAWCDGGKLFRIEITLANEED